MKRLILLGMMGVALLLACLSAVASARPGPHPLTIDVRATARGERFVPSNFAVQPLRVTTIVVRNYTRELHTFAIPAIGVNVALLPGTKQKPRVTRISFVAPYGGTFQWYCWTCRLGLNGRSHWMGGRVRSG